jgi:hypothetical protein
MGIIWKTKTNKYGCFEKCNAYPPFAYAKLCMVTCILDTLKEYDKVFPSFGRSSFFCENRLALVLTLCYENLIGFFISILG